MITEDYVSYEVAKLLKEKGFDERTIYHYITGDTLQHNIVYNQYKNSEMENAYSAPTPQMTRKWLRKTHNIFISVNLTLTEEPDEYPPMYYVYIEDTKTGKSLIEYDETNLLVDENKQPRGFKEPEQAVDVALKYVLENLLTFKKEES